MRADGLVMIPGGVAKAGPVEVSTTDLLARLPIGRDAAIRGADLARELRVTERTIRKLAEALIDEGHAVGSICSGERPGYYLCRDEEDFILGTAHLRSRAIAIFARCSKLKRIADERFSSEAARLFDVEGFTR